MYDKKKTKKLRKLLKAIIKAGESNINDVLLSPRDGLCVNMINTGSCDHIQLSSSFYAGFEHFDGDRMYPVGSPRTYRLHWFRGTLWRGFQLRMRQDLCLYILAAIKEGRIHIDCNNWLSEVKNAS